MKFKSISCAIVLCVAGPAYAQVSKDSDHNAAVAKAVYLKAHSNTVEQAGPVPSMVDATITAMGKAIPAQKNGGMAYQDYVKVNMAVQQGLLAMTQQPAATFGLVDAGRRRRYVVRIVHSNTGHPPPPVGEPYRLVPITDRYPVLAVPAIQSAAAAISMKDGTAHYLYGLTQNVDYRYKISERTDIYQFGIRRAFYDRNVPGSAEALDRWNSSAVLYDQVEYPFLRERLKNDLAQANQAILATSAHEDDAYSVLAPGVSSRSTILSKDYLVVEIANSTSRPFLFSPQDYAYLPGRPYVSMVGVPFRKGPLPMHKDASCVMAALPSRIDYGVDIAEEGVAPAAKTPLSKTEEALLKRKLATSASDLAELAALGAPAGSGSLLGRVGKQAALLGALGDQGEALTGAKPTGDEGSRDDAVKKLGTAAGIDRTIGRLGPLGRTIAEAMKWGNDFGAIDKKAHERANPNLKKSPADKANAARDKRDEAIVASEKAVHAQNEAGRIESQREQKRRAADLMEKTLQDAARTALADCRA